MLDAGSWLLDAGCCQRAEGREQREKMEGAGHWSFCERLPNAYWCRIMETGHFVKGLPTAYCRLNSELPHASLLPNGVRASDAILKCCPAQGIPMMVIPSRIPNKTWVSIIQIPPMKSHRIFMMVERQPGA